MRRLVFAELKKILKSKIHLTLLVLLLGFTTFFVYKIYHIDYGYSGYSSSWEFQDVDGRKVENGLSYSQFADRYLHQFAGDMESASKKLATNMQELTKTYPYDVEDEAYMKLLYGGEYQTLLQASDAGTLTYQDLAGNADAYRGIEGGDGNTITLKRYYKNEHTLGLYEKVTSNMVLPDPTISNAEQLKNHSDIYLSLLRTSDGQTVLQYLENHIAVDTFDSTIGNNLFVSAMSSVNVVTLLILVIVTSHAFSMERQTKADQIVISSVKGNRHSAMAKLLAGILLASVMFILQYLILIVMSLILLPMSDWNLSYMSQAGIGVSQLVAYTITYKSLILQGIFLQYIAILATCMLTMGISYVSKNRFVTATIMFLFLMGTYFMGYIARESFGFLPKIALGSMMEFSAYFSYGQSLQFSPLAVIFDHVIAWKDIFMLFWILVMILIGIIVYRGSKKHEVVIR